MSEHWRDVFHHEHGIRDYDEILVPRMFTPWGELLLDTVGVDAADVALDVACGPGSVTRLLSDHVAGTGRVTGADLSPAMLKIAVSGLPHEGGAIDWVACPADALLVENHAFDVIVCQQGLQFFPDKPAALARCTAPVGTGRAARRRLLVIDRRLTDVSAMASALDVYFGDDAGNSYRAGPFGLTDASELARLVEEAGLVPRRPRRAAHDAGDVRRRGRAAHHDGRVHAPPPHSLLALDDYRPRSSSVSSKASSARCSTATPSLPTPPPTSPSPPPEFEMRFSASSLTMRNALSGVGTRAASVRATAALVIVVTTSAGGGVTVFANVSAATAQWARTTSITSWRAAATR